MTAVQSDRSWVSGAVSEGIVTIGDPRLRVPTRNVADVGEVTGLIAAMTDRLRTLNGAGLAAPQVGSSVKVIVVEVRKTDIFPDRPESALLQMVNPLILERSDVTVDDWEGCFSVPGLMGLVPRAEAIKVEYLSPSGERVTAEYAGYVARVIQHEVDHLDGIEYLDRMPSMRCFTTVQNFLSFRDRRHGHVSSAGAH